MIDTELFDLCKKVYEKTGWDVNGDHYLLRPTKLNFDKPDKLENQESHGSDYKWQIGKDSEGMWKAKEVIPLYTSDYLLEKLPPKSYCGKNNVGYGVAWKTGTDYDQDADTPLKALLNLTLALKEAGEI